MNDQNKDQKLNQEETPKTILGEVSAAKSSNGLKKFFAKRWVSPALFMAAAAIIVTLMYIYQGDPAEPTAGPDTEVTQGDDEVDGQEEGQEQVDVEVSGETMIWPVANKDALNVEVPFYDARGTETEKEAALILVGNTYSPHTGIDFVDPEGKTFDVYAALSGKVTHVMESHPLNGNVIEISHGNGLVTVYQSVANIAVEEGDEVTQGTVIAQAGRSEVEKEHGIHLHFETRMNGETVNPNDYIQ